MKTGSGIYDGTHSYKDLMPYGHIGDLLLVAEETDEKGYDVITNWLTRVINRDFFDHV